MANEPARQEPHELRLENRAKLNVSGVREVESFDETVVALLTARGLLIIRGSDLQLRSLSIDGGQVSVTGNIDSLSYEEAQKTGGFLRRLFR